MFKEHKKALFERAKKNPKYLKAVLAAAIKLPIVLKKRKIEKKRVKIGDKQIFGMFE